VLSTLSGTFHRMHLVQGSKTVEVPTQGRVEYAGSFHWYRHGRHAGSGPFGKATWRFWSADGELRWRFAGAWDHESDVGDGVFTRFGPGGVVALEHVGLVRREVGAALGNPDRPFGLPTLVPAGEGDGGEKVTPTAI
jgi:hypothetical protein